MSTNKNKFTITSCLLTFINVFVSRVIAIVLVRTTNVIAVYAAVVVVVANLVAVADPADVHVVSLIVIVDVVRVILKKRAINAVSLTYFVYIHVTVIFD